MTNGLDVYSGSLKHPIRRAAADSTERNEHELQSGQVLHVISTDPGSVKDFAAFARQTGNELLASAENNKEYEFFIKRK